MNISNHTIRKILHTLCLPLLLSGLTAAWAQEPVLSLRAPSTVSAGQAFEISYSINVRGSKSFRAPAFKGLDLLFGPAQSQSSSFQFVNGKQSQSFTLSYTYQLRAPQPGSYHFGKASIVVDGKTYESEPFNLEVTPAAQNTAQQGAQGQRQNPNARAQAREEAAVPAEVSDKDLFVTASVNKRTPYAGEQVLLTYRIYTAIPVEQFSIYKTPSNKGFWTEELKLNADEQEQEVIDNKLYVYADIRKVAIFAQEAGAHTLEPMEVEALAQVQAPRRRSGSIFDMFDDAFFTPTQTVKKNLRSKALRINAKPLPAEGRPASFDGLVGDYKIDFNYDKNQQIKANEAVTFTFTVSGKGNIEMIHAPQIQFPPDFEVYEPKISHNKQVSANGVSGSATFEYIVVPRNRGVYKINAFQYSFFNPQTERYVEKTVPEIVLNVEKGKDMPVANASSTHFAGASGDISYIRTQAGKWSKAGQTFLFSPGFWLLLLGECALFAACLLIYRKRLKRNADIVGTRNRKAAKEAKRCLRKAVFLLDEKHKDAFHIEISQALWGFLANKLNIPQAELSLDNARSGLKARAVSDELTEQFIKTLEHCEFERFSPAPTGIEGMKALYSEAENILYRVIDSLK
ncbi:MAG: BatD family protein [Bacteroides sp.]|nr:BatD family protein [Bacteroides sp.]MCM1085404.1 BatD family protein [Bacteroides sp.]